MKIRNAITASIAASAWVAMATYVSADDRPMSTDYSKPDYSEYGPQKHDWEFTLGGSGSSDRRFRGGSGGFDASLGFFLNRNWELALRQSMNFIDQDKGSWSGDTRGAIDFHIDLHRFQPFVGANFGGLYGDGQVETFAAGLEAGLKFYALQHTFLFGRIEYQWLFRDADRADNNFDDGAFIYSIGVGFNF